MEESWIEHKGFELEAARPYYIEFPDWWYKEHKLEPLKLWTLKRMYDELRGESELSPKKV